MAQQTIRIGSLTVIKEVPDTTAPAQKAKPPSVDTGEVKTARTRAVSGDQAIEAEQLAEGTSHRLSRQASRRQLSD